MQAHASLATQSVMERGGRVVSRVDGLRSQAPLVLRPVRAGRHEPLVHRAAGAARVALASGAAGPLGGDELFLDIHVGAGSTLVLSEISATLLLPGARAGRSRMRITMRVDEEATLVWLPEPVIAARGCDHAHDIRIDLARSARLFMRDELLLGRHREAPGDLLQSVQVRREGEPLFMQQLQFGPGAPGMRGPAVLGGHKCVGTALAVCAAWEDEARPARLLNPHAAVLPLAGPAVMINALAEDTATLRRQVRQGMAVLGPPWSEPGQVQATPPAAAGRRVQVN